MPLACNLGQLTGHAYASIKCRRISSIREESPPCLAQGHECDKTLSGRSHPRDTNNRPPHKVPGVVLERRTVQFTDEAWWGCTRQKMNGRHTTPGQRALDTPHASRHSMMIRASRYDHITWPRRLQWRWGHAI